MTTRKQTFWERAKRWVVGTTAVVVAAVSPGCTSSVGVVRDSFGGPRDFSQPYGAVVGTQTEGKRHRIGLNVEYQRSGVEGNPVGVDVDYTRVGIMGRYEIGPDMGRKEKLKFDRMISEAGARYYQLTNSKHDLTTEETTELGEVEKILKDNRGKTTLPPKDALKWSRYCALEAGVEENDSETKVPGFDPVYNKGNSLVGRIGFGVRRSGVSAEAGIQYRETMDGDGLSGDGEFSGYVGLKYSK